MGKTVDTSLNFLNEENGFYFKLCKNIEIKNLKIIGNLVLENCTGIELSNIEFNGVIKSKFSSILFNNTTYHNLQNYKSPYGIYLDKSNFDIYDSKLYGSASITNFIIYSTNETPEEKDDYYRLSIKNTYMSGEYESGIIKADYMCNVTIEHSEFVNGFTKSHGSVMNAENSIVSIKNTEIKNNRAEGSGGCFFLKDNYFNITDSHISNSTSFMNGGIFHISQKKPEGAFRGITTYNIVNVIIDNIIKNGSYSGYGIIIAVNDYSSVNIANLRLENIECGKKIYCSLITLSNLSYIQFTDFKLNNISSYTQNGFLISLDGSDKDDDYNLNSKESGPRCVINGMEVSNITQLSERISALFWMEYGYFYMNDVKMKNIKGNYSGIFYNYYGGLVIFSNSIFEDITYSFTEGVFNFRNCENKSVNITVNNVNIEGALFSGDNKIYIEDSKINNINVCNSMDNNSCIEQKRKSKESNNNVLFRGDWRSSNVGISNTTITNFYGYSGFRYQLQSYISLDNTNIENCYFENGFLYFNEENYNQMYLNMYNSIIKGISSLHHGSIINVDISYKSILGVIVNNTIFENNISYDVGGIIYSLYKDLNKTVQFNDCTFKNNEALTGKICYSQDLLSEPYFSNKDELISSIGNEAFATNPTHIELNNKDIDVQVFSGNIISDDISVNLYDDYNNKINMGSDIDMFNLGDIVFFTLEMNDPDAKFIGQTTNYCFGYDCNLPDFKIIGKAGIYHLNIKIEYFGKFNKFKNNTYSLQIKVKECPSDYKYQYRECSYIKSCYIPTCEPPCVSGECVNDNVCLCNKGLTGQYCNEYFKLKRVIPYDVIIIVISLLLVLLTIIVMVEIILYRNNDIIREGGGKNFLIIILIGILLNCLYIILRAIKRTQVRCLMLDITKQIGFSLVFGTILVKTLRIYFAVRNRIVKRTITSHTMYILILMTVVIHSIIILIAGFECRYLVKMKLTSDYKEYQACQEAKIIMLSKLFNIIILIIGCFLAYSIRNVKKEYKESMNVTVYSYLVIELFLIIIPNLNVSLVIEDIFNTLGPLLYSFTTLYQIFITKFLKIYERTQIEIKMYEENEKKRSYNVQRYFDDYTC